MKFFPPTPAEAFAASVKLVRQLGFDTRAAEVIADGYSLRVRAGPIVTRVMTAGIPLRGNPWPWMQREVDLAGWLLTRGAAVVPPWTDAGPHDVDGIWVSAWSFVENAGTFDTSTENGAAEFGRCIGNLHASLRECPLDLPLLAAPVADIAAALGCSDHPVLHRAAARLLPQLEHWPRQVLHGDVHSGNLLSTARGPTWIDFEDACVGPAEWDLASATVSPAVLANYPHSVDARRLAVCRDLRRLQVIASLLVDQPASPEVAPLLEDLAARY